MPLKTNLSGWVVVGDCLALTGARSLRPSQCSHMLSSWIRSVTWGSFFDHYLSFSLHISQLTHTCYYQLCQLWVVYHFLSYDAAATLIHAFVTSRLDYCCLNLVVLPLALVAHLDQVLCCAVRLIKLVPK